MKTILKSFLRIWGRIPLMRNLWLNGVRRLFRSFDMPSQWRDRLMWDVATQILDVDFETTVQLGTGPQLVTGMDDNVTRAVMFFGELPHFVWEPHTLRLALRLQTANGMTIVAGGHIGYHALHLALAQRGRVVAFEPVSRLYERLTRAAALSQADRLTAVNAALDAYSRKDAVIGVAGAWSSLNAETARRSTASEVVQCFSLDDYAEEAGIARVNLMLLDVEGRELEVLAGASKLLEAGPDLILEVTLPTSGRPCHSPVEVYRSLFERGYSVFAIVDEYAGVYRRPASETIQLKPLLTEDTQFSPATNWFNILATRHPARLNEIGAVILP